MVQNRKLLKLCWISSSKIVSRMFLSSLHVLQASSWLSHSLRLTYKLLWASMDHNGTLSGLHAVQLTKPCCYYTPWPTLIMLLYYAWEWEYMGMEWWRSLKVGVKFGWKYVKITGRIWIFMKLLHSLSWQQSQIYLYAKNSPSDDVITTDSFSSCNELFFLGEKFCFQAEMIFQIIVVDYDLLSHISPLSHWYLIRF